MPAISAYSAIFPTSSAAIWLNIANHQAPLYALMCQCAVMRVLYEHDMVDFVWEKFMQNTVLTVPNIIKQIAVHIGNKLR